MVNSTPSSVIAYVVQDSQPDCHPVWGQSISQGARESQRKANLLTFAIVELALVAWLLCRM